MLRSRPQAMNALYKRTHAHYLSRTLTLILAHILTHSLSRSLPLSFKHTYTNSLSLSHRHFISFFLSHSYSHTLSLSLTNSLIGLSVFQHARTHASISPTLTIFLKERTRDETEDVGFDWILLDLFGSDWIRNKGVKKSLICRNSKCKTGSGQVWTMTASNAYAY